MNKQSLGRSGIYCNSSLRTTGGQPQQQSFNDLRVAVMFVDKEARSETQANVASEGETEESRKCSLTEKGYTYGAEPNEQATCNVRATT